MIELSRVGSSFSFSSHVRARRLFPYIFFKAHTMSQKRSNKKERYINIYKEKERRNKSLKVYTFQRLPKET